MITKLRAFCCGGQVWGFGDTDEQAVDDALTQMSILEADPTVDQTTAPTGEWTFHDITFDQAKRVANGDRTWKP